MKYMMADKGVHPILGYHDSIGHNAFDHYTELCFVNTPAVDGYYVGHWVEGMGLINVLFPEDKVRDLTPEEIQVFSRLRYKLADNPSFTLDLTESGENLSDTELAGIVANVLSKTDSNIVESS